MAVLITNYWGESTTDGLRLRRVYDAARDSLEARFDQELEGLLRVCDLAWLSDGDIEHFLVRGTAAETRIGEPKLSQLVSLLTDDKGGHSIGIGLAIYGQYAADSATEVRDRIDTIPPRSLRFVENEFSVEQFGRHLLEWMTEAANEVIARAGITDEEHVMANLTYDESVTARGQTWEMI